MKVSVSTSKSNPLERNLNISFTPENLESLIKQQLQRIGRNKKINGFRPGKVPVAVLQQQYGSQVTMDILDEQMNEAYRKALQQEQIIPAEVARFDDVDISDLENITFTAVFEVFPEIKLTKLSKLKIQRAQSVLNDDMINDSVEQLRQNAATWEIVERSSQNGDQLTLDFTGYMNDEAFDGGSATQQKIELGSKSMIPGFEDALLGVSSGEEREFTVQFPTDYQAEHLAGKEAQFKCLVHSVAEKKLPEITDDAFIQRFKLPENTLEALKADLQQHLEKQLEQALYQKNRTTTIDALLEAHKFSVPKALVEKETQSMIKQIQDRQKMYGVQPSNAVDLLTDDMQQSALKRIQSGLILQAVLRDHTIELDESKVQSAIEEQIANAPDKQKARQYFASNQNVRTDLENAVLEKQIIEFVLENAKINEEVVDCKTLLSNQPD